MSRNPELDLVSGMVQCPTCRASQEWSDTCRRCKSDLRLLREFATAYQQARRGFAAAIRANDPRAASRLAKRCHALQPDATSRQMLATAALLQQDYATAATLAIHEM